MFDREMEKRLDMYFDLATRKRYLFKGSRLGEIILERERVVKYEMATGEKVGVIFDNEPEYVIVTDVIEGERVFTQTRIIPLYSMKNKVVVPVWCREEKEPLLGFCNVFRHGINKYSGLAFPACRANDWGYMRFRDVEEFAERYKACEDNVIEVAYLGETVGDGNDSAMETIMRIVKLSGDEEPCDSEIIWLTESEAEERIKRGEINDTNTLAAMLLYKLNN